MTSTSTAPPPINPRVRSLPCCPGVVVGEGPGLAEPVPTGLEPAGMVGAPVLLGSGMLASGLAGTLEGGSPDPVGSGFIGRGLLGVGSGVGVGCGVGVGGGGVCAPVQEMSIRAGQLAIIARTVRRPDTKPNDTVVLATPLASVIVLDGLSRSPADSDRRKSKYTICWATRLPDRASRTVAVMTALESQRTDAGASRWTTYGFWPM